VEGHVGGKNKETSRIDFLAKQVSCSAFFMTVICLVK